MPSQNFADNLPPDTPAWDSIALIFETQQIFGKECLWSFWHAGLDTASLSANTI